jgi:TfuA protein
MTRKPLVYLGPTLPLDDAKKLLEAEFRPPIKRGDLTQVVKEQPVIVIIDGEFGQSLSVSPKEILQLLDRGVKVVGASSMGALRAAELNSYGMEGVGWVFDAYHSGRIVRDDEVAVTYSPYDFSPLTIPLVNVRHWLEQLQADRYIDRTLANRLFRKAQNMFFTDRTPDNLKQVFATVAGRSILERLMKAVSWSAADVKAQDARLALNLISTRTPFNSAIPKKEVKKHGYPAQANRNEKKTA